jgi:type I site-specific restriction endonuclease
VAKSIQPKLTPEEQARATIDGMLEAAGWLIQNRPTPTSTPAAVSPSVNSPWVGFWRG